MSRRIDTGIGPATGSVRSRPTSAGPGGADLESFLGRLVKYVPAEIVGLYVAAMGLPSNARGPDFIYQKVTFIGCALLTPLFLTLATREPSEGKGPLWLQVVLGTIAFPVWAYAVGAPWPTPTKVVASVALLFVTVGFGAIKPPAGS